MKLTYDSGLMRKYYGLLIDQLKNYLYSILEHNLNIPYLESIGTDDWNLTPKMLINNFDKEIPHATKVKNANTNYPIEIYYFRDQRIILDGVHRFTKLVMNQATTIKVRKITDEILPLIKKTPEEFKKWKGEGS